MRILALAAVAGLGLGLYVLADDKPPTTDKAATKTTSKATAKTTAKATTATAKAPAAGVAGHPLDAAFANARDPKSADEGLLNNAHFQRAVLEALRAKQAAETGKAGAGGPTPAAAARARFLEALSGTGEKK